MNTQKRSKGISKKTGIATALCTIMSVLLLLMWFLPVCGYHGDAYGMLEVADMTGDNKAVAAFWLTAVFYVVMAVWAIIPRKWAAIVGIPYSAFLTFATIMQIYSWTSNRLDLTFASGMMIPLAVIVLGLSITKLVFTVKDKKRALKEVNDKADAAIA